MTHSRPVRAVGVRANGWGWRHSGRKAWAVSGLDVRIEPGERVLLLGASGAGKSTLFAALAGVIGGDDDGESVGELVVDGRAPDAARGSVGLVLQDPDSQVILSRVGDDVAFGCENLGVPRDEIWTRVADALGAVGLDLPLDHPTDQLSGGQKQRLALAGVLAMDAGLVLLDEPTANLDPDGVREVRDSVARALDRTGATMIVIEHRVDVWLPVVNRIIILAPGGGVLADGAPDDVLGTNGRALAASGIWVPEFPPVAPTRGAGVSSEILVDVSMTDEPLIREPLIHAEKLGITRDSRSASRGSSAGHLLQPDLEFSLAAGELLAVTGRNGVGKSTLALTLGGLIPPGAGRVVAAPSLAAGISPEPIQWKSRQLLTRIGSVFQDAEHQFLAGTVRDELAVGPRALGLAAREVDERVDLLLTRLRLESTALANPFTLSGGEKRRLSVGTALATRPRVLVLDEPTFGQDSRTWKELVELLGALLDDGTAVVAITHDRALVSALAGSELRLGRQVAGVTP